MQEPVYLWEEEMLQREEYTFDDITIAPYKYCFAIKTDKEKAAMSSFDDADDAGWQVPPPTPPGSNGSNTTHSGTAISYPTSDPTYGVKDSRQRALIKWKDLRGGQARFEKWEPMGKEKAMAMLQASYPQMYDSYKMQLSYGQEIETKNYYMKLENY